MTTSLKRHVALRVGYAGFKPVYAYACPVREDGLERHIGVRVGYFEDKPVYAYSACLPAYFKTLGMRGGYGSFKPVFLYGTDCCEQSGGGGVGSSSSAGVVIDQAPASSSSSPGAGSSGISTPCCSGSSFPTVLNATFANPGTCSYVDGQTFALTYDSVNQWWEGCFSKQCLFPAFAGDDLRIRLQCASPFGACTDFLLNIATFVPATPCGTGSTTGFSESHAPTSCSCSPISMTFTFHSGATTPGFGCCNSILEPGNPGGAVTVTVTV